MNARGAGLKARRWLTLMVALLAVWPVAARRDHNVWRDGAIVQGNPALRRVALVFTADAWDAEADDIATTLKENRVKASFFFTGNFLERHAGLVRRLLKDGHYVSGHGYAHMLYADWTRRDSTLVSRDSFATDVRKSYAMLASLGVKRRKARYFIPPYEHYNRTVAGWAADMGLQMVCFTPGSGSNADYTVPSMKNYRSSAQILQGILQYESAHTLNGHFLLLHLGTHPERTDKFCRLLPRLIRSLRQRGYKFVKVNEMVRG